MNYLFVLNRLQYNKMSIVFNQNIRSFHKLIMLFLIFQEYFLTINHHPHKPSLRQHITSINPPHVTTSLPQNPPPYLTT